MFASKFSVAGTVLLLSSLPACSDRVDAAVARRARVSMVDSSAGAVAPGMASPKRYRAVPVIGGASIEGKVSLHDLLPDSAIRGGDPSCDDASKTVAGSSTGRGETVRTLVWLEDITTGKPLPEIRRERLTIERCQFEPHIMAVVTQTTIIVFSRDRVTHAPTFYREGVAQPIQRMQTVDAGQVVPSETITAEPGIIEVRCAEHPSARAYIGVFDHPYFAVTDRGAFRIDGLPAGTYTVNVWNERLHKPVQQRVTLAPNGTGNLDVQLALK